MRGQDARSSNAANIPCGKPAGVVGRKQVAGLAVADQLAVAADVGGGDDPLLRHRLQWLQRRNQLGQPARDARKNKNVGKVVIAADLSYAARGR